MKTVGRLATKQITNPGAGSRRRMLDISFIGGGAPHAATKFLSGANRLANTFHMMRAARDSGTLANPVLPTVTIP